MRLRDLTPRDYEIIKLITAHGGVTKDQVAALFFPDERQAANRLSKLTTGGVLSKEKIAHLFNDLRLSREERFGLGKNQYLYRLGKHVNMIVSAPFDLSLIRHDILATDALCNAKRHLGGLIKDVILERNMRGMKAWQIPDLTINGTGFKLAVEIERTLKRDKSRYYKKCDSYRRLDYTHVLYVCANRRIEQEVAKLVRHWKFVGVTMLLNETSVLSHGLPLKEFVLRKYKNEKDTNG